jgi:hypothetical protein
MTRDRKQRLLVAAHLAWKALAELVPLLPPSLHFAANAALLRVSRPLKRESDAFIASEPKTHVISVNGVRPSHLRVVN